jgi:threonine dehydrogenase-like Zn-dependent dehydrogenase
VDPGGESPYEAPGDRRFLTSLPAAIGLAMGTIEKLRPMPVPWQHVWRAGERLDREPSHPVIFECVGVAGILCGIIASAPLHSRVVEAGVCVEPDIIRPVMAINKEVDLRFVVGYAPLEFSDTLHMLARGKVKAAPIATGTVGLPGVEAAFDTLATPGKHAKIIIEPASSAPGPVAAS